MNELFPIVQRLLTTFSSEVVTYWFVMSLLGVIISLILLLASGFILKRNLPVALDSNFDEAGPAVRAIISGIGVIAFFLWLCFAVTTLLQTLLTPTYLTIECLKGLL